MSRKLVELLQHNFQRWWLNMEQNIFGLFFSYAGFQGIPLTTDEKLCWGCEFVLLFYFEIVLVLFATLSMLCLRSHQSVE